MTPPARRLPPKAWFGGWSLPAALVQGSATHWKWWVWSSCNLENWHGDADSKELAQVAVDYATDPPQVLHLEWLVQAKKRAH